MDCRLRVAPTCHRGCDRCDHRVSRTNWVNRTQDLDPKCVIDPCGVDCDHAPFASGHEDWKPGLSHDLLCHRRNGARRAMDVRGLAKKGCLLYTSDAADEEDSVDL